MDPPTTAHDDDLADILRRLSDDDEVVVPTVGTALTRPTDVERPERATAAVIESEGGIDFDPEFASYGARAVGLIVDALVLGLIQLPAFVLLVAGSGFVVVLGVVLALAGFAAATALYARDVSRTGQSIGNRVAGTRVVDARNGKVVPAATAATRYVVRMVISPILFLGFLVAFTNSSRRTFHDQFAGTVVTRPPRATWSIDDEPTAPGP